MILGLSKGCWGAPFTILFLSHFNARFLVYKQKRAILARLT